MPVAAIVSTSAALNSLLLLVAGVYQFSPLPYTDGFDFSYSNDASLLLPTNAWTGNYMAATWQRFDANAPDTWPRPRGFLP